MVSYESIQYAVPLNDPHNSSGPGAVFHAFTTNEEDAMTDVRLEFE
jgi:hypothetical protein